MSLIERCRTCGFEHVTDEHVYYQRNHVSNKVLPFCGKCSRRLYNPDFRPGRTSL